VSICFDDAWCRAYVTELNQDLDFAEAARWFDGVVAYRCGQEYAWFEIHRGGVRDAGTVRQGDPDIELVGQEESFRELFSADVVNGAINRLWRQGKIDVQGNLVQAMKFWLMIYWLTEAGDRVPPNTR
jgi:hypothetical protein